MNVTIVLPSLNPDEKLNMVVDGLLGAGFTDIVIVNDGSDEQHMEPFVKAGSHKEVTVLTHEVNRGKGRALKTAFSYVMENRADIAGVVTVDGDNQHMVHDIKACAEKMTEEKDKVVLGCRDFSKDNVPFKSRFGNNSTSMVFGLFCGIKISDTQTGLRAIPYQYLSLMCETEGERFEYETEMFFTLKKNHIAFLEVPIETVYIEENASTHFHPIKDSLKIYRLIFRYLFRYLLSSGVSFLIDYGLYTLLILLIGSDAERFHRLFFATFPARAISSVFNYAINRKAVFQSEESVSRTAVRYYALCLVQTGISFGIVYLLSSLCSAGSVFEVILKPIVDIVLLLLSFQVQQKWVFR
ncbi:MAG: bifunctional glycosyltransferase family 2/GtrA family protein [Bacteroidales bacterium]|nr:bifunctional glycosyltransferase family 2/GtrA family protein [Lachnoclostridium sp.]MCM1384311.1 bifunctional glycosyltransferase family 2/GtrA family protein [Lachnoclostridium sp.]MCM1464892.1 bifunctional glycosyltransferase family 2/GtrA family protein [Bacteroidales bacterium]